MIALALAQRQGRLAGIEQMWGKDPCAAQPVQTPNGPRPSTFGINFDKGPPLERAKQGIDIFECLPRKIDCPGADEIAVGFRGQYGCMKMADIEAGKHFCDAYPNMAVCTKPGLSTPVKVGIGLTVAAGVLYLATRLPMIALALAQRQGRLGAADDDTPTAQCTGPVISDCYRIGYGNGYIAGLRNEKERGDKAIIGTALAVPLLAVPVLMVSHKVITGKWLP